MIPHFTKAMLQNFAPPRDDNRANDMMSFTSREEDCIIRSVDLPYSRGESVDTLEMQIREMHGQLTRSSRGHGSSRVVTIITPLQTPCPSRQGSVSTQSTGSSSTSSRAAKESSFQGSYQDLESLMLLHDRGMTKSKEIGEWGHFVDAKPEMQQRIKYRNFLSKEIQTSMHHSKVKDYTVTSRQ